MIASLCVAFSYRDGFPRKLISHCSLRHGNIGACSECFFLQKDRGYDEIAYAGGRSSTEDPGCNLTMMQQLLM
jgi:hypothetical protein